MIEKQKTPRSRGRPQVRPDDETRQVIVLSAERQFCDLGYETANINIIAQNAGVSTKTLYRLFPTKADLFERVDFLDPEVARETGRFVDEDGKSGAVGRSHFAGVPVDAGHEHTQTHAAAVRWAEPGRLRRASQSGNANAHKWGARAPPMDRLTA